MTAYYNDNDPRAAAILREMIRAGLIVPGDVDERSIADVQPEDLDGYTQCHFFAGIGGWSLALRAAGWRDDMPVWTGSCPCQPFSVAGKRKGKEDARHLWPELRRLIQARAPIVCFGEQVASNDGIAWFGDVQTDLDRAGYTVGCTDTCAAGFGAPHVRQRLYWVADARGAGLEIEREQQARQQCAAAERGGEVKRMEGNSIRYTSPELSRFADESHRAARTATRGYWSDPDWIYCRDPAGPVWRPIKSGSIPMAHGISNRVPKLRGLGNALVLPQAQAFIEAVIEELAQNN